MDYYIGFVSVSAEQRRSPMQIRGRVLRLRDTGQRHSKHSELSTIKHVTQRGPIFRQHCKRQIKANLTLQAVSRYREPQLQVREIYPFLFNLRTNIGKS